MAGHPIRAARRLLIGLAALLVAVPACAAQPAGRAAPPVTIEDLLHGDSVGNAEFSPDGRWIVYVREVAVADQTLWGYEDPSFVRSRLFVVRVADGLVREIAPRPDVRYSLGYSDSWSPDGRGLLIRWARRDGYGWAYYDLASGRITELPGHIYMFEHAWTANGHLIYPVVPEGGRQLRFFGNLAPALGRRWAAAWDGPVPQVTVSSTTPDFETPPAPAGALMIADVGSGRGHVLIAGDIETARLASDQRHLAVLRSAERLTGGLNVLGKRSQLELYRLDGDSATLEHAYPGIDFAVYGNLSWSPSGARLLAVGRPTRDAAGQPIDYGLNQSRGTRLYVVSVADGRLQDVAGADLGFGDPLDLTVLPMGWLGETPLAVASHAAGADMEAPPSVGPQSRLEYGDLRRTRFDVFAFPASGRVNLTAQAAGSVNRFLAVPARGTVYYVADGTLWRTTVGGTPERLLPEGAPTIVGFGVDRRYPEPAPATTYLERGNVQRVALTALVDGAMRRMVLDLLTGTLAPLAPPGQIIATAPDLATTVSKRTDNWRQELFLNRAQSTELAHFDIAPPGRAVAQPQRFTFTVGGHELTGWMLLPPGGDGAARLPAVVSVYGGAVYGGEPPTAARTDFGLPVLSAQLLAAAGYVVILPSTPLGMGADSDVMQQLADTVVAAVDALAARGIVDPARVGVMGQSFGGFSTAAILSRRSDRFAAGISLAGVYDFAGGYGLRSMTDMLGPDESVVPMETLLIESGQIHLNRPFWEAPEAYMRNSPIYHVATINSPLLLLHGDLDMSITGLVGAERLYNALQRAGKPAALVRYWGESHVVGSAPAMRDQWQRITTWFGRYLAPRQGERDDRPGSRQPGADGAVPAPPRE